jgi:DNA-binding CsgD family transcriptional regulator
MPTSNYDAESDFPATRYRLSVLPSTPSSEHQTPPHILRQIGNDVTGVFGFVGWSCQQIWKLTILFLPNSPLYAYLGTDWLLSLLVAFLIITPYALSLCITDRISSKRGIQVVMAATWIIISLGVLVKLVLPTAYVLQVFFISLTTWGLNLVWQPYFVLRGNFRLIGAKGIICALFLLILLLANQQSTSIIIWMLPFTSIMSLIAYAPQHSFSKLKFITKDESIRQRNHVAYIPFWYVLQACLAGIGAACLFSAGMTFFGILLCISIVQLASGLLMYCGAMRLLESDSTLFMTCVTIGAFPLLLSIPFVKGVGLIVVGAILILMILFKLPFSTNESLEQIIFESEKVDFFILCKGYLAESGGILLGVLIASFVLLGDLAVHFKLLFFSIVLLGIVFVSLTHADKIIKDYEHMYLDSNARPAQPFNDINSQETATYLKTFASLYQLTPRQLEVLALLARGYNQKQISAELFISAGTTRTHVYYIYKRTSVHSQQELINLIKNKVIRSHA